MGEDADDADFERELRDLLLTAFADGENVEGDWELETVPDLLPDWRVCVERRDEEEATDRSAVGESA